MVYSVNTLANMQNVLYPMGMAANCPSYQNGYMATNNSIFAPQMNNAFAPMMSTANNQPLWQQYSEQFLNNNGRYYNPAFSVQSVPGTTAQSTPTQTTPTSSKQPSEKDLKTLEKYYGEMNSYNPEFSELLPSAAMIGFTENAQVFKHPFNSYSAMKDTNKIFNKNNKKIMELFKKYPEAMQKAYGQYHALSRMTKGKVPILQGWFQKSVKSNPEALKQIQDLQNKMSKALEAGDTNKIVELTEKMKAARGMDGYIPTLFGSKALTPEQRIVKKSADIQKAIESASAVKPGATGLLKQGLKEGKTFALFGLLIDSPKIISAYKNGGADSAITQTCQTGVKALADGVGWTVGRAAGTAIGTKVGTAVGTAICPGVGTAVGAVIGFLGGALGSIVAGKLTHAFMPTDEATKLEAQKAVKDPEQLMQLIAMMAEKQKNGEEIPDDVIKAAENVLSSVQPQSQLAQAA